MSVLTSPESFALNVLKVKPHPTQAQFLNCRARVKVACCGRRWGKSYVTAVDLIWFAVAHRGTVQFVVAPTADQATIIFGYVVQLAQQSEILAPQIKDLVRSPFPSITIGDSTIHARGAGNDGKYLRGHGADRIVTDEDAYLPFVVVDEVIPPMLAASQYGEQVRISTAFGLNHFWDAWTRGQDSGPHIQSFQFPSSENPMLSPSYLDQQKREMTEMAYAVEYGAEFREDQAAVFPWSLIQKCLSDIEPPDPVPADHRYGIGYDPAKWVDRSGLVVLDHTERPWQTVDVRDISGRDYLAQAPVVKATHDLYNKGRVLMDSTSHDQLLEQLKKDGVKVAGYQFTNASKEELFNGLVIEMEQDGLRIPNHRDLVEEMKYYRYELTAAGNVKLGALDRPGIHDDLVTALALAVQQAKSDRPVLHLAPGGTTRANPFAF